MKISVDHLSGLARLQLSEEEKNLYEGQINNILGYIEKLSELNTEGIEPTSHVISLQNVMRDDIAVRSLEREEALKNAPDGTGVFYRVPKIIE